jgi:hypothetical protein
VKNYYCKSPSFIISRKRKRFNGFHVARLYEVVPLTRRGKVERLHGYSEFRVDVRGYKYKRMT